MTHHVDDLLDSASAVDRWIRLVALPVSIGFHVLLAMVILSRPPPAKAEASWIEMAVVEPPAPEVVESEPEPEPEPEPQPEPQPEPELDAVAFDDTIPDELAPPEPPPERRRVVRRVQGLSATSFAEGAGTGMAVRRGNTTAVAATDDTLGLDDEQEFVLLPVASVTTQPTTCTRPPVQVPKEAIEAEYEGTLRMTLDLAASGSVIRVHFLDHADHGVEQACRTAALDMRCRPARKDGVPVSVTGMPHRCTIKALD